MSGYQDGVTALVTGGASGIGAATAGTFPTRRAFVPGMVRPAGDGR